MRSKSKQLRRRGVEIKNRRKAHNQELGQSGKAEQV